MTAAERFKDWAVLELFGHRKYAGLVQEVELAGAPMLRIDVPSDPPVTQFYGAKSVYCMTPVDEDTARRYAAGNRPEPISRWELRTPALPAAPVDAEVVANEDDYAAGIDEVEDSNEPVICESCGETIPEGEEVHERDGLTVPPTMVVLCGDCVADAIESTTGGDA